MALAANFAFWSKLGKRCKMGKILLVIVASNPFIRNLTVNVTKVKQPLPGTRYPLPGSPSQPAS